MKKILISYFGGFLSGVLLCATLFTIYSPNDSIINANDDVFSTDPEEVTVSNLETNRTTKNYEVDWFKDNSNYIWDTWKIK